MSLKKGSWLRRNTEVMDSEFSGGQLVITLEFKKEWLVDIKTLMHDNSYHSMLML